MDKINILTADDMEAHRRRLKRIIDKELRFNLVGSVDSGEGALKVIENLQPDVILMDIEMETPKAGLSAAFKIIDEHPNIKVIMLTIHQDEAFISSAFQSGVIDYLDKTSSESEIVEAIKLAYLDSSPIRPKVAAVIRKEFSRIKQKENERLTALQVISCLSPAEMHVLWWLSKGKTRQQIADLRTVELETVKKQIKSILKKFKKSRSREVISLLKKLNLIDVIGDMLE